MRRIDETASSRAVKIDGIRFKFLPPRFIFNPIVESAIGRLFDRDNEEEHLFTINEENAEGVDLVIGKRFVHE